MKIFVAGLAGLTLFLAGCETMFPSTPSAPIDTVSIRYDPYNYSMSEVEESARAACRAKGGTQIYQLDSQINTEEVRWAYMNFECF